MIRTDHTRWLIAPGLLVGYRLVFLGIGLFAQGWRELYRAHQQKRLATDGLSGVVRHQ